MKGASSAYGFDEDNIFASCGHLLPEIVPQLLEIHYGEKFGAMGSNEFKDFYNISPNNYLHFTKVASSCVSFTRRPNAPGDRLNNPHCQYLFYNTLNDMQKYLHRHKVVVERLKDIFGQEYQLKEMDPSEGREDLAYLHCVLLKVHGEQKESSLRLIDTLLATVDAYLRNVLLLVETMDTPQDEESLEVMLENSLHFTCNAIHYCERYREEEGTSKEVVRKQILSLEKIVKIYSFFGKISYPLLSSFVVL